MPDDLTQLRRRHQTLAARLGQIGFALPGSITRRYTCCRKPGCRPLRRMDRQPARTAPRARRDGTDLPPGGPANP
jgi:hypothetical protein